MPNGTEQTPNGPNVAKKGFRKPCSNGISFCCWLVSFAKVACKRTGLAFDGQSPETELRQIWPSGEWRRMELLLDTLGKENSTLTDKDMEDCRQAALQLSIKTRRSWAFRDSIVQILRSIFELEKEVFTLKTRIRVMEKKQHPGLTDPETLVLPAGTIWGNTVRTSQKLLLSDKPAAAKAGSHQQS